MTHHSLQSWLQQPRTVESIEAKSGGSWSDDGLPPDFPRALGTVVIDRDTRAVEANVEYHRLFGLAPAFRPYSLEEFVLHRVLSGSFKLSELISAKSPVLLQNEELETPGVGSGLIVSPAGRLVLWVQQTDLAKRKTHIQYLDGGISLSHEGDAAPKVRALLIIAELLARGSSFSFLGFLQAARSPGPNRRTVLSLDSGELEDVTPSGYEDDIKIKNLMARVMSDRAGTHKSLDGRGMRRTLIEDRDGCFVVSALRVPIDAVGTAVNLTEVMRWEREIVTNHVRASFPDFSPKEAEVLAVLSVGNTVKEAAALLDKSNVTVALQARSALAKSGLSSMERLLAKTAIDCW